MAESIGERIKALRIQQGLTLAGVAEKTGLSSSYLSQIQRDKTTPSLATLTVIARALNVGLRYFFEDREKAAYIIRADDLVQTRASNSHANSCQVLVPNAGSSMLNVCRMTIQPQASAGALAEFVGEEMIFVLCGELIVDVGDEHFELAAGDSIHFDAAQAHSWRNVASEAVTLIWSSCAIPTQSAHSSGCVSCLTRRATASRPFEQHCCTTKGVRRSTTQVEKGGAQNLGEECDLGFFGPPGRCASQPQLFFRSEENAFQVISCRCPLRRHEHAPDSMQPCASPHGGTSSTHRGFNASYPAANRCGSSRSRPRPRKY